MKITKYIIGLGIMAGTVISLLTNKVEKNSSH